MNLPVEFLASLENTKGFNKEAFVQVHESSERITSVRFNPNKLKGEPNEIFPNQSLQRVPWTEYGFYLSDRPSFTFDPLFHAGVYYVQEASSMFLEQALKQTVDLSAPLKVLDLCAAPGGKSTHIQSLISTDSLLVSNEVIRSRASILKENLIKWGGKNVAVTNNDPADFAKLEHYFDVIVVDAPCSGSGLFRRDETAIEEWSLNNVALCSQRQQRILADVVPALKPGGILVYSTCSYSEAEDEEIIKWLNSEFQLQTQSLEIDSHWGIVESAGGYRFWPHLTKGEGLFLSVFKKEDDEIASDKRNTRQKIEVLTKGEREWVSEWIDLSNHQFIKHQSTVYLWPEKLSNSFLYIKENLRLVYSGIQVGELMRNKLVPDHALALNGTVFLKAESIDLTEEAAIRFLQRKDISLENIDTGWKLASYKGHSLGWMNVLKGRINNYYPKEWRILKEK